MEVEPDGMTYLRGSVRVAAIRNEDAYGGRRVTLNSHLGAARLRIQVDVGIGDAVSPQPEWLDYPSLLGLPRPRLRAYRPETAIAEKVHAMVMLGTKNSRMRDYFDVYVLTQFQHFSGGLLSNALRTTFERRRTEIPDKLPLAFTPEFSGMQEKRAQWRGFLRKNDLTSAPTELAEVTEHLAKFIEPLIKASRQDEPLDRDWKPGGPWKPVKRHS